MTRKRKNVTALLLVVTGVLFITVGTFRHEPDTVLKKAVRICLECVGIG